MAPADLDQPELGVRYRGGDEVGGGALWARRRLGDGRLRLPAGRRSPAAARRSLNGTDAMGERREEWMQSGASTA